MGSTTVARDAYGYSLGYYTNDYKPIGGSAYSAFAKQYTQATGDITGQSLYNGNISTSTYFIRQINGNNPVGYTYHYDQLNRIKELRQHSAISTWNAGNINGGYQENFTYDGNGNILTLNRAGATSGVTDVLAYQYNRDSNGRLTDNKLNYLNGTGNATSFGPPQSANNYSYDPIGNMTADNQAEVSNIQWSVYGKIQSMTDSTNTITYTYNTAQERITKQVKDISTWYVRDAQGNTMAVYDNTHSNTNWREQHLYGGNRLGMWTPNMNLTTNNASTIWDTIGHKYYELSNHLGNIVATLTDKRIAHITSGSTDYYFANVVTAQDYYAFGALMPNRTFTSSRSYRYGFNGKENDNEVKGIGNQQDYGMRIYDGRVGRFLSVDPIAKSYPELSSYQFASNRPISSIDQDGLEADNVYSKQVDNTLSGKNLFDYQKNKSFIPWIDLLTFHPSQTLVDDASRRGVWGLVQQPLERATGDKLNLDYYSLSITKLPSNFKTGDQFFTYIRLNFMDFVKNSGSSFGSFNDTETSLFNSKTPLSALMRFEVQAKIYHLDALSIMTTQITKNYWIFSPVSTTRDFNHPVAGNRQFGLINDPNGSFTFYIRGADRPYTHVDAVFSSMIFNGAEKLWSTVMKNLADYINENGGRATINPAISKRISWKFDVEKKKDKSTPANDSTQPK